MKLLLFRKTLTTNQVETVDLKGYYLTVLNVEGGNLYIDFDRTATTESLLIPEGMGRSFIFPYKVKKVSLFSDGTPTVQLDNLRG